MPGLAIRCRRAAEDAGTTAQGALYCVTLGTELVITGFNTYLLTPQQPARKLMQPLHYNQHMTGGRVIFATCSTWHRNGALALHSAHTHKHFRYSTHMHKQL